MTTCSGSIFSKQEGKKLNKKILIYPALFASAGVLLAGCGANKNKQDETLATSAPVDTITPSPPDTEKEVATEAQTATPIPTSTPKPTPTNTPSPTPEPTQPPETSYETEFANTITNEEANKKKDGVKYIFIGDSRFNGLMSQEDNSDSTIWKCSSSGDYDFMTSAFSDVDASVGKNTKVFINLGLNDLYQSSNYAATINEQAQKWQDRGAKVYFVSVGPVSSDSAIANSDIMNFNTAMYNSLDIPFIDLYNYLVQQGFECVDTINYSDATNVAIYSYLSSFFNS